ADPQGDRLQVLSVPESTLGGHSEEHILVNTPNAGQFPPGSPVLTLPTHICPTCALYRKAYVIEDGTVVDEWDIVARDRVLRF
ncbi:D-TA family PLP-dependent enzyme, partial [Singulisphaera rosea]